MTNEKSRFQYVPSSGTLPGKDFEEQTEAAINELCETSEEAKEVANEALDTANQALKTANDALDTANTAQSTANTALNMANTALDTANTAIQKADNAMDRANDAYDKSVNAESLATQSGSSAAQANKKAEEALKEATRANQTAEQAQAIAVGTSAYLENSLYYQRADLTPNPFVLNNQSDSGKYINFNVNMPNIPVKEAGFITIRREKKEDGAANYRVYQNYHSFTNQQYNRVGTIGNVADGSEAVTWGNWVKVIAENDKVIININNMLDGDGKIKDGYLSNNVLNSINNYVANNIINIGNSTGNNPLKDFINSGDFLNFPPKVGFFDERTIPIYATFNMNFTNRTRRDSWVISDTLGREVIYFTASNGKPTTGAKRTDACFAKLYKATRISDSDQFSYENNYIKPAYMKNNPNDLSEPGSANENYVGSVVGLGSDYIAYSAYFNGKDVHHLVHTDGSSVADKWTKYKDITPIMDMTMLTVLYDSEQNTIATLTHEEASRLRVYRYSDLTLLKTHTFPDIKALVCANNDTVGTANEREITNMYLQFHGGATYVKALEVMVIYKGQSTYYRPAGSSISANRATYATIELYKIPKAYFANSSAAPAITQLIPDAGYGIDAGGGFGSKAGMTPSGSFGIGCGPITVTYDEYEETIRTCRSGWDDRNNYYERVKVEDQKLDKSFGLVRPSSGAMATVNIYTPDGAPWSKWQWGPVFINNKLIMHASSRTYGDRAIMVTEYERDTNYTNYIMPKAGKWILFDGGLDRGINVQRINNNTTYWYRFGLGGSAITKFTGFTEDYTAYVTEDESISVPSAPPGMSALCATYNWNTGMFIMLAFYNDANNDPNFSEFRRFPYVVTWKNGNYKVCTDLSKYPDNYKNYINHSYNAGCVGNWRRSNMFIDLDASIYVKIGIRTSNDGGWWSCFLRIVPNGDGTISSVTSNTTFGTGGFTDLSLSYDKTMGYTLNAETYDTANVATYTSRDYYGGNSKEYTLLQFMGMDTNGNGRYNIVTSLAASTGLIAFCQETPMFLGGYYSVLPAQQIILKDNQENHIYVVRDRNDRGKINISVKDKKFGSNTGENAFNRILASTITTSNGYITKQEDYEVNDFWRK